MSTNEKDYSDYIKHLSNMGSLYALFAGFMFTSITVLITRLQDPISLMAQFTLFFFAVMLDVFIFCMADSYQDVFHFCKNIPPYTKRRARLNLVYDASIILGFGGATILLFLLYNLAVLALAQTIAWSVMIAASYTVTIKPFYKKRGKPVMP